MEEKLCSKCMKTKSIDDFYCHPRSGRSGKCTECSIADRRSYRANNIEYYREYDRKRYARCSHRRHRKRKKDPAQVLAYRRSHPERRRAERTIHRMVLSGKIERPRHCSRCGSSSRKIEAHHEDYSKPTEVVWLCSKCHGDTRRKPMITKTQKTVT
jgi:ribosomal protein S27AE